MEKNCQNVKSDFDAAKTVLDKWKLLPAFLKAKGLVKQHIDSYNYFVTQEMQQIVRANANRYIRSDVDSAFFIEFLSIRVGEPHPDESGAACGRLTPMACRLRDITYAAPIFVDVDFLKGEKVIRRKNVEIGRLPVMLHSAVCILSRATSPEELQNLGECPQDPGGYFVVKGTERVILMQEQPSKNRIIVEYDYKHCLSAAVTSATAETKSRTQIILKDNGKMYLRHNSFVDDIPLWIALKAMGLESDQEAFQLVGGSSDEIVDKLILCVEDAQTAGISSQTQALLHLGRKLKAKFRPSNAGGAAAAKSMSAQRSDKHIIDEAIEVLHRIVLSHVPSTPIDFTAKSRFLCLMARRLLDGSRDPTLIDDKDYYGNKRIELAGQLISLMFEDLFKRFCTQIAKQADQSLTRYHQAKASNSGGNAPARRNNAKLEYPDCFVNFPSDIITRGMQSALSTGNWTIKRFRMERTGVSQVLSRFSYIASIGMMTRLSSNVEKGRKVSGPRALQPSQWGMLCPCDTPEGEACGLVKNLALMTHVTTDDDPVALKGLVYCLGVEDTACLTGEELHNSRGSLVFLNGSILGVHRRPKQFVRNLRSLRRLGKIGEFVSIFVNQSHRAIYIASDGGRLCRPLIIVENCQPRLSHTHMEKLERGELTFSDFLRNGILEWIDVNEENNLYIALKDSNITTKTTHTEIDPLTIMGVVAGLVPYPNHNQSPRNTYQCAMGKQAMGAVATNMFLRTDTVLYLLCYPQRPLCKTRTIDLVGFENLPAGQNASVAVMSYSGYDIEDAIVMNRYSIDRGFGRCFVIKRTTTELKKNYFNGAADRIFSVDAAFANTSHTRQRENNKLHHRYRCLDDDGVCHVGDMISEDQVYINKYSPINTKDPVLDPNRLDISQYRPTPSRYKAPLPSYIDRVVIAENNEAARIYKVVLRQTRRPEYGDKFSSRHGQKGVVGCIVPQEDMPFNEAGWCPDLIMNPHGFPSRMTVGKLLELIAGKSALIDGVFKYGTAFSGTTVDVIEKILRSRGFHYSGKEYLTSGITGQPLQTYVFVGPIYYQKLKHMVQDKIHARGRGPRQLLTRQPTEGRSKEGGLRLGEMERDCLVAYGTANLLLERLMLSSDVFQTCVCSECGLLGYDGYCTYCKSSDSVQAINLPYACKLLFQEMTTMNVCPKLRLKKK